MNLSEFKTGIAARAAKSTMSGREISLGTVWNILNSRAHFSSSNQARLKTASDANYHSTGGYYLLNIAVTTTQRRAWCLKLVADLAVELGFDIRSVSSEEEAVQAFNAIVVSGDVANYCNEILNAATAVAITRNAEFKRGQLVDCVFDMQLSTATGLQELRFSTLSPVKMEMPKVAKSSLLGIFGSVDELEDNSTEDSALTAGIIDNL